MISTARGAGTPSRRSRTCEEQRQHRTARGGGGEGRGGGKAEEEQEAKRKEKRENTKENGMRAFTTGAFGHLR